MMNATIDVSLEESNDKEKKINLEWNSNPGSIHNS